jgi:2-C-methyl-D-erythritol 4-phosphate cytidylyltransferase
VLSRLRQAFRANPSATHFILHGQNHPGFEELVRAAESFPVSVVGIPVRDTCKEVVDGIIQRTVPREALVDAVGPWIFSRQGLEDLLSRIQRNGERIASLADLAEAVPARVRVLTGPWQTSSVWPPP